ncbi:MAG: alpha-hydroxy acid oxidase [Bryobacteraceae bacterium]|nr:alpha-hydroxy acid oxidase [Bryobacteraceae bacterium]
MSDAKAEPEAGNVNLAAIRSLYEFEPLSKTRLSPMAYEYLVAGVADEITLHANRSSLDRIRLLPRTLVDVSHIDTAVTLFGRRHECPLLLAPCAYQKLFHPDGELEAVRGANESGATFIAPCFATVPLEETAAAATQPLWFQLYVNADRGFTRELVQRAEAAGYEALVVTVDVPVNGPRDRELRAGFALPKGLTRANLLSLGTTVASAPHRPGGRNIYSVVRAPDVTPEDIEWLKSITKMPLIVKGVLHPDVAARALQHGADAIYVSNHGGRSMDSAPATIDVLPHIVRRVGGVKPVLFDGGVRRGSDVFKALALGADAVGVGRPFLHGLAVAGAAGVARVVEILWAELAMNMGLAGATSLDAIDASFLWESSAGAGQEPIGG